MKRVRSAVNLVTGMSEDPRYGYRHPVECNPHAWRCSACGGGLICGPKGTAMFHPCSDSRPNTSGWRYMGFRRHMRAVWGSLWGNRPTLRSSGRRAVREGEYLGRV